MGHACDHDERDPHGSVGSRPRSADDGTDAQAAGRPELPEQGTCSCKHLRVVFPQMEPDRDRVALRLALEGPPECVEVPADPWRAPRMWARTSDGPPRSGVPPRLVPQRLRQLRTTVLTI